jgi:hypothetical protein
MRKGYCIHCTIRCFEQNASIKMEVSLWRAMVLRILMLPAVCCRNWWPQPIVACTKALHPWCWADCLNAFLHVPPHECNAEKQHAVKEALSKSKRPTHTTQEYNRRPKVLQEFPLHFSESATDIMQKRQRDGTFLWFE